MKRKKKRGLITIIYILIIALLYTYREPITSFAIENIVYSKNTTTYTDNSYTRKYSFKYISYTEDFVAHNARDILNIVYTVLDGGMNEFTFYCDKEYVNCQHDIESISNNTDYLTLLNNFINPFNSYKKLYVVTNTMGRITLSFDRLYSEADIQLINNYIDEFERTNITNDMSVKDKIKAFHDYVINNTKYDSIKANEMKNKIFTENINESHKATGIIKNHLALCSGYTDMMALYLDKLQIKNYKVSNDTHIWNALMLDGEWYHLDLTWDDPVTNTGRDLLIYEFFIIDTDKLISKDTIEHTYSSYIYKEIATKD